jgi:hypothetical protein
VTWQKKRRQAKDVRISFFPNRPVKRRDTDIPIAEEKVLKSRQKERGTAVAVVDVEGVG